MVRDDVTYVKKSCAYITRNETELLVFEGPGHSGYQIPKGTVESGEDPREALFREVVEESGIATFQGVRHLATDVWQRRESRRYVRHFYRVPVHEPRDAWTHTVTGGGEERGTEFECSWLDLSTAATEEFALDLDDYLHTLPASAPDAPRSVAVVDD